MLSPDCLGPSPREPCNQVSSTGAKNLVISNVRGEERPPDRLWQRPAIGGSGSLPRLRSRLPDTSGPTAPLHGAALGLGDGTGEATQRQFLNEVGFRVLSLDCLGSSPRKSTHEVCWSSPLVDGKRFSTPKGISD